MIRATERQRSEYQGEQDLYGFVSIDGQNVAVETFPKTEAGIKFEVVAPKGFRFFPDEVHCHPCYLAADVKSFAEASVLVKCSADCDCHDD